MLIDGFTIFLGLPDSESQLGTNTSLQWLPESCSSEAGVLVSACLQMARQGRMIIIRVVLVRVVIEGKVSRPAAVSRDVMNQAHI